MRCNECKQKLNIELIESKKKRWIVCERKSATIHFCVYAFLCFFFHSVRFDSANSICFNWQAWNDSLWRLERQIIHIYAQNIQLFPTLLNLKLFFFLSRFWLIRYITYYSSWTFQCSLLICSFFFFVVEIERARETDKRELFRPKKSSPIHKFNIAVVKLSQVAMWNFMFI